jgi:DNA helicase-2/ATP-dependent DNA helicase PcrA
MISLGTFFSICKKATEREPNDQQKTVLKEQSGQALFIVAGPGTGKTACLTLRILKLIFVDDLPPASIMATTFTKKAAAELRSRLLSWGFGLVEALQTEKGISSDVRERAGRTDINQVLTGTIDSICEQLLQDYRDPGTMPPVMADEFVAKTLLLRDGMLSTQLYRNEILDSFLGVVHGSNGYGFNLGRKVDLVQSFWDRRFHDQVDWEAFLKGGPKLQREGRAKLDQVLEAYQASLSERNLVDFSLLEQEVLQRVKDGKLKEFTSQLRAVLVDEYQDTNLLQETIYFELARACKGALSVVGDDDQSLYRFRGATVELFRDFSERYAKAFGPKPKKVFLKTNYRSTKTVLRFANKYAVVDRDYQSVRVTGKPLLVEGKKAVEGIKVLGMFRETRGKLASSLADFIHQVFRGKGYLLPNGEKIQAGLDGGDVGDCALLCGSPAEYSSGDKERLPLLLRRELGSRKPPIEVFNPRGEELTEISKVEILGGLLLECLDPGGEVQDGIAWLGKTIGGVFNRWRKNALDFLEKGDPPKGLKSYAIGWAERDPRRKGFAWPNSVPVLELLYGLMHFFPDLHDNPEGQVYLEVFARQLSACESVGKFKGRLVTDPKNPGLSNASIKELLVDFLGPIASGTIKVNEDLLEAFPRDRLSILSIHQAKGLEFPMTIVDVASDFNGNYPAQAFKRFPEDGGPPHRFEDMLRPYSDLDKPGRSQIDRAFDDLYRQFFVAFSRPQKVLLLVGLRKSFPDLQILNVATGCNRDGLNQWSGKNLLLMI